MTIIQFQYVLAVAQHRNFTVAAERCFVTQPTLSMQIQKLEEQLGVLIFDRTKKPLQITEIGNKIIEQARNIVAESERINDIVSQHKKYIGGVLRLGIIPTVAPTLLPLFLNTFVKKYPKVNLKIEELNTKDIIQAILERSLDVAIVATPLKEDLIEERPLYYEPFVAYLPQNHKLKNQTTLQTSDININDLLMLEDGHCFRENVINICNSQEKRDAKELFEIKSGSFETLIRLVNEGIGMTLLPYLHTLGLSAKCKENLSYFSEPSPAREISLVYHNNKLKMPVINALYEVISGVIRGVIAFENVKIISPLQKNTNKK